MSSGFPAPISISRFTALDYPAYTAVWPEFPTSLATVIRWYVMSSSPKEATSAMDETQKFLFDLQGYIVARGFLAGSEVKTLNDAFDANWDRRGEDPARDPSGNMAAPLKRGIFTGMLTWEKPWCQPFRALLAHPHCCLI